MSDFPSVPGGYPFPRLELEVLEQWRQGDVFRRSLESAARSLGSIASVVSAAQSIVRSDWRQGGRQAPVTSVRP